jgi:serine/threonine-protein kinase PknK
LAAARVRVLPPAALFARLDPTLSLLSGGGRDQPDRLQTMRAAIAWSSDLLTPLDQALFGRLSTFAGGFTLDAADSICKLLSPELRLPPSRPMLDVVQSLVENSLLHQVDTPDSGEPRYRMLETIREFGLERLAASGERSEVEAAHAAHVLTLAESAYQRFDDADYERVLAQLDAEHDNVRAALAWAEASGESEFFLRLADAMGRFWAVRGYYREGRRWLERALACGTLDPTPVRLRTLRSAGWLARLQGDSDAAATLQTESLLAARAIGDPLNAAAALQELSLVEMHRGQHDRAISLMEEALALLQEAKTTVPAGAHLVSVAHANVSQIALAHGDADRAAHHAAEAVRRQRALGYSWALGDTLRILGDVALAQGDHAGAAAAYRESVELTHQHGDRRFLTNALSGVAAVAAVQGQAERAARLYGAIAVLRDQLGLGIESSQRVRHDHAISVARSTLPQDVFDRAWAAGRELSLEDAIAESLTAHNIAPSTSALTADNLASGLGLTPRETEVLRLLAEGLQDRQIAEALFITPRTASFHVTNLLAKLGVDSRTEAAALAISHGLA